jgi:pyridoxal phosphate enzyme (YggS family)
LRPQAGAATELVGERLAALQREIAGELRRAGRDPAAVTLVGVSKRQPPQRVVEAIHAGLDDIGESYVQEAVRKFALLPPVRKHFIGHLQTNKARSVAEAFDMVQSVDRLEAGLALSNAVATDRALPVLLQLNVTGVERFGCRPNEAERLAERLRALPGLRVEGVMAMGPLISDRDAILRAFELAAKTWQRVGGSTLSIGMSGDWREALQAGSTMLRIGEAIFGPREDGRHL